MRTLLSWLVLFGGTVQQAPTGVQDRAGVLTREDADAIQRMLSELQQTTSTQGVLLTVTSTAGQSVEHHAREAVAQAGLGDRGFLILIATEDRTCRIEVQKGLRRQLTDEVAAYIVQNVLLPKLKTGEYSVGARAAVEAAARGVRGELHPGGQGQSDDIAGWKMACYGIVVGIIAGLLTFKLHPVIVFSLSVVWPFLGVPLAGGRLEFGSWFFMFIVGAIASSFGISVIRPSMGRSDTGSSSSGSSGGASGSW